MDDQQTERERKRFRFSLKSILLLLALVAVILGSYAIGFRKGYRTAKEESAADYVIWKDPAAK